MVTYQTLYAEVTARFTAAGIEDAVGQLHIRKAAVIHKDQARLIPYQIHPFRGVRELGFGKCGRRYDAHNGSKESAGLHRVFMLQAGQLQYFFVGQGLGVYFHKVTSCRIDMLQSTTLPLNLQYVKEKV